MNSGEFKPHIPASNEQLESAPLNEREQAIFDACKQDVTDLSVVDQVADDKKRTLDEEITWGIPPRSKE